MQKLRAIPGLDTLRLVAAATVALSQGAAFPLADALGRGRGWIGAADAIYGVSFDGVAAALAFFIISGLCIHRNAASGAPERAGPFWLRRGVRILAPLAVAQAIAALLGPKARAGLDVVLWSLWCELIYYGLYPLLRIGFRRHGAANLTIASLVISGAAIVFGWGAPAYAGFSVWFAWLAAAPAWMLGCVMAEQLAAVGPGAGMGHVWAWRLAVWGYAALAMAAVAHSPVPIGYPALLFPFPVLAYLWILAEVRQAERRGAWGALEWAGRRSYSLYLIHGLAIAAAPLSASALGGSWALRLAAIVGGALVFHAVIEAPAHALARASSRRLAERLNRATTTRAQLATP
jgi:peptidoglycan/LPS O-acetylase OafA/YrhL